MEEHSRIEYERVREEIAKTICDCHRGSMGWDSGSETLREFWRFVATSILSLDGIEIRADDCSLPENTYTSEAIDEEITESDIIKGGGWDKGMNAMLKAGFVKVISK